MKVKKLTPRQEESLRKKNLIYEEGVRLFREYGFENTTIQDICRATGTSVGSIYHFFGGGKDDILRMLAKSEISDCSYLVEPTPENINDPLSAIFNFFIAIADGFDRLGVSLAKPLRELPPNELTGNRDDSLSALIEAAQKAGTFDDSISLKDASDYFFLACEGMISTWIRRNGEETLVDYTKRFMPRLLETFRKTPGQQSEAHDTENT